MNNVNPNSEMGAIWSVLYFASKHQVEGFCIERVDGGWDIFFDIVIGKANSRKLQFDLMNSVIGLEIRDWRCVADKGMLFQYEVEVHLPYEAYDSVR